MGNINDRLNSWTRNVAGQVIFKSSEEAVFYATLIYDNPQRVREIKSLRRATVVEIGERRKRKDVNLELLLQIAYKHQFYRECIEEVDRLKDQTYTLGKGGK